MSWLLIALLLTGALAANDDADTLSQEQYLKSAQGLFDVAKEYCALFGQDGFNLQHIAGVLGKAGPFFAAIGPVFALLQTVLPEEKSPEMKAIEQGFKEMRVRFDYVDMKLDKIMATIEKAETYTDYVAIQYRIWQLENKQQEYVEDRKNKAKHNSLRQACLSVETDPQQALNDIYQEIRDNNERVDVRLMPTILSASEYNMRKVRQIAATIIANATKAAVLRQTCLGVLNATEEVVQYNANASARILKEIATAFGKLEQELRQNFRNKQLRTDVLNFVRGVKGQPNAYVAEKLKQYLEIKYDFLYWGVYVWNTLPTLPTDESITNGGNYAFVMGQRALHVPTNFTFDVGLSWLPKERGALVWHRLFNETAATARCKELKGSSFYKLQEFLPNFSRDFARNNKAAMIDLYAKSDFNLDLVKLGADVEIFYQECQGKTNKDAFSETKFMHHMIFSK